MLQGKSQASCCSEGLLLFCDGCRDTLDPKPPAPLKKQNPNPEPGYPRPIPLNSGSLNPKAQPLRGSSVSEMLKNDEFQKLMDEAQFSPPRGGAISTEHDVSKNSVVELFYCDWFGFRRFRFLSFAFLEF